MPRASVAAKPRKRAAPARKPLETDGEARPAAGRVVAVPVPAADDANAKPRAEEPVWLVRAVLVHFLDGFAAFLAREVYSFVQALG